MTDEHIEEVLELYHKREEVENSPIWQVLKRLKKMILT